MSVLLISWALAGERLFCIRPWVIEILVWRRGKEDKKAKK
jgi:hypothetical protein